MENRCGFAEDYQQISVCDGEIDSLSAEAIQMFIEKLFYHITSIFQVTQIKNKSVQKSSHDQFSNNSYYSLNVLIV